MKNLIAFLTLAFTAIISNATTIVVNNRVDLPVNPGQYTTIQAAVAAAANGDTILVAGSVIPYSGTINFYKKLTFIGPGYNPDKQYPLIAKITGGFTLSQLSAANASGSTIMGFYFEGGGVVLSSGFTLNNITIRRNYFSISATEIRINDSTSNLFICENFFKSPFPIVIGTIKSHLNFKILNNIFTSTLAIYFATNINGITNYSPITFAHNLFIAGNKTTPLVFSAWQNLMYSPASSFTVYNFIIKDNIFYNTNASSISGGTITNFTYSNNITFAGATLPLLPPTGSVGAGNLNNTDPQFVSIFNTTNTVDFNLDNLRLQSTSPARNAATDGSDIGPTGGTYPIYRNSNQFLTGEPTIPEIKSMNFVGASAVTPGGTLQITIKAKKIN